MSAGRPLLSTSYQARKEEGEEEGRGRGRRGGRGGNRKGKILFEAWTVDNLQDKGQLGCGERRRRPEE